MSSNYWRKREEEWKNSQKKSEEEYIKQIQKIYLNTLDSVTKEIESFFSRYATKEGISMAEAKKKVKKIDIEEYKRKAEKYVKEKDFSDQANEEMRLYNLTMKVNRLELLKANIGAELVNGTNELQTYCGDKLDAETMKELERNAAILGPSVLDNAKNAKIAVDSSFQNATWSERVWNNQTFLKNSLSNIIANALIQGKNARDFIPDIRKQFDVSRYQAERLLRTELARARVQAQAESYKAEDIEDYEYVACSLTDCCKVCKALDGKTFKVKDMEPGENAPPMHPNCHCATAPYMDREEFDEWLDGYSEHGLTFEEWKNQSFKEESLRTKKNEDYSVDWKKIKSKEYTNRFSGISDNPKANALAAKRARNMLKHRDCADTEELYAISLTKGTDVSSILNQQYSRGVKRTEKFDADVRRSEAKGEQVLIMHNHPGDSIPSIADLNELFAHANAIGITVGHKGSLYLYTRPSRVLTDRDFAIASMKAKGYYYSKELPERVMTILSEEYDFVFKVL